MANTTGPRSRANGEYIRGADVVATDARAAELRSEGLSYSAIAREMGWASKSSAYDAVQRAFRATLTEPADQARAVELARLETLHDAALGVLQRRHLTVSHGRIITVKDDDGHDVPLIDDGPVLQAIDRIVRISESRRKLLGLDAPARVDLTMEAIDAALAEADDELAAARLEAAEAGGAEGEEG